MKTIQRTTIITGCLGISFNVIGLILSNDTLNFVSVFLGRLAALLFSIAIDGNKSYYYLPLSVSIINVFVGSQQLLFLELLTQSVIYQISAFKLFTNNKLH